MLAAAVIRLAAAAFAAIACTASADSALRSLDREQAEFSTRAGRLEVDIRRLRAAVDLVVQHYLAAENAFRSASARYDVVQHMADASRVALVEAERNYATAERLYRMAVSTAIAAGISGVVTEAICGTVTTTRQLRRALEASGASLRGMDVDHVFPRSLGGADSTLNYQVIESSVNRSMGNSLPQHIMSSPIGFVVGIGASAVIAIRGCGG